MSIKKSASGLWRAGRLRRKYHQSVSRRLSQMDALQGEGHPGTERDSVNAEGRRTGRGCTWPWSMAKLPCFWFSILALRGLRRNDYFQIHHRKFKMFWNKRHLPIHMPMTQRRAGLFSLPQHHSLVNSQRHTTRQWLQTSSSAKMCPHSQTPHTVLMSFDCIMGSALQPTADTRVRWLCL